MDSKSLNQAMDELAENVRQCLVQFLEETDHIVSPEIHVQYMKAGNFGTQRYSPTVKIQALIQAEV